MQKPVLVGYATRYGSSREVAEKILFAIKESGRNAEIHPLREVKNLADYRAVVMGAPLFMFKWHMEAKRFLSRHRESLEKIPVVIFALGPTHDPRDENEWQESIGHLNKELAKFPWLNPVDVKMFGGKYAPEKLKAPLKWFAGAVPASDIRDWEDIHSWAGKIAGQL